MSSLGPTGATGPVGPRGEAAAIGFFYRETSADEFPYCLESRILYPGGGTLTMFAPSYALITATKDMLGENSNDVMIMNDSGRIYFKNKEDAMLVKLALKI